MSGVIAPSERQLEALRSGDPAERLALVHLAAVRDAAAWPRFLAAQGGAAKASGGRRRYAGRVDTVLCGGAMRFDWLLVDEFPSRELAVESLRLENAHAKEALAEAVVLAVKPRGIPGALLAIGGLAARVLGRGASEPKRALSEAPAEDPAISPDVRALETYLTAAPAQPFCMLNLNRHRERARYAEPIAEEANVSGAVAYRRYGRNTLPYLLRRAAGPIFAGEPIGLVVGDPAHPLAAGWDELLLVRYPRRAAMLDMLTAAKYQAGLVHRSAGLERAALLATTPVQAAAD